MPNLLAHYGAQGPISRAALPGSDLKWILTGVLLPDLPWIPLRAAGTLFPGVVDPYGLRLYLTVQASLLFCLLLALALALLTPRPRRVFGLLALNSFLALLLDAMQTKWAAGVHLLAPFSWKPWSVGLFWPESAATVALTVAGIGFVTWAILRDPPGAGVPLRVPSGLRAAAAGAACVAYLGLPFVFLGNDELARTHYVDVLRHREERPGRYVEFDRVRYVDSSRGDRIRTYAGEEFHVQGADLESSGTVSVQGRFVTADTVRVLSLHRHPSGLRDLASYAGLAVLVLVWGRALL